MPIATVADFNPLLIKRVLSRYALSLSIIKLNTSIPGSYWGDSEAGLILSTVYVRPDTPIHSLLHEACHYICMDSARRDVLDTNAAGDYHEENAVCYLQILLSDEIISFGQDKMLEDMDRWGYTFRLGSAKKWFEEDATDAKGWLLHYNIIDKNNRISFKLRA